jgi:hypothetical protein
MTSSNDPIVLYGGQGDIFSSLNLSAEAMIYMMLETADKGIEFLLTAQYSPEEHWTILRLHAFGPGGDLLIRRDEDRIFWRFVGYEDIFNQLGLTSGTPYPKPLSISGEDERSLLWGAYWGQDDSGQHYWQENRVGKAQLTYPFPQPVERVEIHACRVLDVKTQETVAYWTYALAEHQPQEKK